MKEMVLDARRGKIDERRTVVTLIEAIGPRNEADGTISFVLSICGAVLVQCVLPVFRV